MTERCHTIDYTGMATIHDHGDSLDVLFLVSDPWNLEPLAEVISDDMWKYGHRVDVAYWVADQPATLDELQQRWTIHTLGGELDAEWNVRYSDVTGYLFTDEELKVGGHDLLAELTSHVGKYIHLRITYHGEVTL